MHSPNLLDNCLSRPQLESYARGTLQGQAASACEEHLDKCGNCQSVLAELFESGNRPDWLRSSASHHDEVTRIVAADDSTLPSTESPKVLTTSAPRSPAAHLLWQQQQGGSVESTLPGPTRVPQIIGRYRIQRTLGSGGFGQVYLALDEKLQRKVALKVPHYSQVQSQVHWDLMLAEAQTVAALDHVAIVPIYDVAATDEVPMFLVSKLIEGQTLAERVTDERYSPLAAAQLMIRIADALQYAHDHGVIHRDIKPQNILLDQAGQVYLADFGLAWRTADISRAFPSAGTPFYMSPEQLSGDSQAIDARSDIYSLAKVMQQMLGGFSYLDDQRSGHQASRNARSLMGHSPAQLSYASSVNVIQPLARLPEDVPNELRLICEKATAAKPHERYQTVAEFAEALQRFVAAQAPMLSRYRRYIVTGVAVTACVVFSILGWLGQARNVERHAAEQSVEALLQSDPSTLIARANAPELLSVWAKPALLAAAREGAADKRLRARLGMMRTDDGMVGEVAEDLLGGDVELSRALVPLLLPYRDQLVSRMWHTLQEDTDAQRRLNAAAYLAVAAERDERWQDHQLVDSLLKDLISYSVSELKSRVDSLINQRELLLAAIRRALNANQLDIAPLERLHLNSTWELMVRDDLKGSIELMLCGPPSLYTTILNRLNGDDPETLQLLRDAVRIDEPLLPGTTLAPLQSLQQRHLAAMALLKFGHGEDYWPLWRSRSDPTHLALQISLVGFEPLTKDRLIARLRKTNGLAPVASLPETWGERLFRTDLSERRNLLLALSASHVKKMLDNDPSLLEDLKKLFQEDADPCIHALSQQMLARAGSDLPALEAATQGVEHNGAWFHNSLDVVMVVIPNSPANSYRYAICNSEVQRQHFEQFLKESEHVWTGSRITKDIAAAVEDRVRAQTGMSWYDAAAFCNWLSRREGLQECYLPNAEGKFDDGMRIKRNSLQLDGYRIPTGYEWENAGRAGTTNNLYFGDTGIFAVRDYTWDMPAAQGVPQAVGQRRPNSLGLFDIHGNASEWTTSVSEHTDVDIEIHNDQIVEHRGGHVLTTGVAGVFFSAHETLAPNDRSQPTGLRVVRTLR